MREAFRAALLWTCVAACCCVASASEGTPDRVYDFTDKQSFTIEANSDLYFKSYDEVICGYPLLIYDNYEGYLKLDNSHEIMLPRYSDPVAKIEIFSALDNKKNSSLTVKRTESKSEIDVVRDAVIYQDDPYGNSNSIDIPEQFDIYADTHDICLSTTSSNPVYIQQMKVYFRKSGQPGTPSIVADGCGYGDMVTVSAPGCTWIRVCVTDKNGKGRERTVNGDKAELRLLDADAFGGELEITATASPQPGTELDSSTTLVLPALPLTSVEMEPVFTPGDLTGLTAPASFSCSFGGGEGWRHYYAVKAADSEINPYFDYLAYTEGSPIIGDGSNDILLMTGVNGGAGKYYTVAETIGIKPPENNAVCRYDEVSEEGEIRELEYGTASGNRNVFYNYYVLAAKDRTGNVAVMSDTRAATGYCAVRPAGTESISAGTGAAEFGLVRNDDGTYAVIVAGSGFGAAPGTSRDDALKEWIDKPDTRVLSYSDFDGNGAAAAGLRASASATATADRWTVTAAGLSHGTAHSIVYDAANHTFACSCTVPESDSLPTYLAANLKEKNGGLSTGINDIRWPSADEETEWHETVWYTLQGIRIDGAPTVPGLYVRATPHSSRLCQVR